MARGVWYLVQAAAVAAAVVGATNVQVGALVSTASLEHSNPFQVPPPGNEADREQAEAPAEIHPYTTGRWMDRAASKIPCSCTITAPSEEEN